MSKHPYRAALIWLAIIIALINIYPTVGWYSISKETREAKLEQWKEEDVERAQEKPNPLTQMWQSAVRWAQFDREKVINLGLDLQGGIHMVLGFDYTELDEEKLASYRENNWDDKDIQERVQETVLQQVRRRVNEFEAKEPVIQALGANQIQIQLPGEKDLDRAKRLITKTAQLDFHIVAGIDETSDVFLKIHQKFPKRFTSPFYKHSRLRGEPFKVPAEHYAVIRDVLKEAAEVEGLIPEDKMILFSQPPKEYDEDQEYSLYLVEKESIASGDGLRSAAARTDDRNPPYWQIIFTFNGAEGAKFGEGTEKNINRAMAIVIDNVVLSAPVIRDRITTTGTISGSFEGYEANDLAIALNSGSMVVPVHEELTQIVGASLGEESVNKGIRASLVGIFIVGLFMAVYYMAAGVVAVIALAVNAIFIIAAMAYFGMTLTLPGIAGLILTVGMAVDANVLIFERIREEIRLGHSLLSSIEGGFTRATVTILDANVTTLIAAAVLMQFGTGPIEGFAVTLSVGVCSSVFAALIISRALMDFVAGRGFIQKLTMMSLIKPDTKYPFLNMRWVSTGLSLAVIVAGMAIFAYHGKDNFGVDFTQGTNLALTINAETAIGDEDLRGALSAEGFDSPMVQRMEAEDASVQNRFLIRVGEVTEDTAQEAGELNAVGDRIRNAFVPFTASKTVADVVVEQEQTVGPAVGKQLRNDALKAIFYSLIFIVIYLWIRFELKFACGAVVALTHDVLVAVGLFSLFGRQINMPVIAALLTIIGYSLNDTIVVFDRIREDLAENRGKGVKFLDILNVSINATLSRTLLTSITTLFVVVVLYIFGGEGLNDFALVLIIGVVVGTYSSIFIASPVVYAWQVIQEKRTHGAASAKGENKKGKGGKKKAAKNA